MTYLTPISPGFAKPVIPLLLLMVAMLISCTSAATPAAQPPDSSSPDTTDPREFAISLVQKAGDDDWQAIQAMSLEEFHRFDTDALNRAMSDRASLSHSVWDGFTEPDQWEVEGQENFTMVRVKELPVLALTLRERTDGTWQLDPGPAVRVMAEWFDQGFTLRDIENPMTIDRRGSSREVTTESDISPMRLGLTVREEVVSIAVNEDTWEITMLWTFNKGPGGQIPIDQLSWAVGNASGPAEVLWTTAKIQNGALIFPGSGNDASTSYLVTFGLDGVPETQRIQFSINDIKLTNGTVDGTVYSVRYDWPLEEFPAVPAS
ncbi:MAG: hypothetical protein L0177_02020 [Chloroflexi bacterium]|nr:hypothetical protein [Chloroflexota bacterium]